MSFFVKFRVTMSIFSFFYKICKFLWIYVNFLKYPFLIKKLITFFDQKVTPFLHLFSNFWYFLVVGKSLIFAFKFSHFFFVKKTGLAAYFPTKHRFFASKKRSKGDQGVGTFFKKFEFETVCSSPLHISSFFECEWKLTYFWPPFLISFWSFFECFLNHKKWCLRIVFPIFW